MDESGEVDAASQPQAKVVVTPVLKVPSWIAIKPLIVASSSVFTRTFMLQLAIAGAAAMATRSGGGSGSEAAAASIAAHQVALQLWLLCSFVCDALAAASQALVADRLGREDAGRYLGFALLNNRFCFYRRSVSHGMEWCFLSLQQYVDGVRGVSKTVFGYSLILGFILAGILGVGNYTGFLLSLFTEDKLTQDALKPLLLLLIVAQPLNSFVFAADGVLQGASAFSYQAKSMILSVLVAFASFFCFQHFASNGSESGSTLIFVWYSLVILQLMRGVTSLWKLLEANGPIDALHRRQEAEIT